MSKHLILDHVDKNTWELNLSAHLSQPLKWKMRYSHHLPAQSCEKAFIIAMSMRVGYLLECVKKKYIHSQQCQIFNCHEVFHSFCVFFPSKSSQEMSGVISQRC